MAEETIAQAVLKRYPLVARAVGWASLAALVLGVITKFLGSIRDLRQDLFELFGIDNLLLLHYTMTAVVVLLFLAGYLFGWLWIYKRFVSKMDIGKRRLTSTGLVVIALLLASASIYASVPSPPDVRSHLIETSRAWTKELLEARVAGGGLRTDRADPSGEPQVWSTAQSLVAILVRPSNLTEAEGKQIREHFEFFEHIRLADDEGWGYMEPVDWGVTEISAWVALAYVASMETHFRVSIWGADYPELPLRRLTRELTLLKNRQLSDGSWSPIKRNDNPRYSRTYSTVMSVWALVEARNQISDADTRSAYDDKIKDGILWLLNTYNAERESWVPNPGRVQQLESFAGLTAQVLFVLGRAQSNFGFIMDGDEKYGRARSAFFKVARGIGAQNEESFRSRPVTRNDRTHDSDRYLPRSPYMVESSTYLWFPWSLAYCLQVVGPQSHDTSERDAAKSVCRMLVSRVNEMIRFAKGDPFAYVMAESLLAVNLYLQAEHS